MVHIFNAWTIIWQSLNINENCLSYRLHKLSTPKVLRTDKQTDGRSGPTTRPAFAKVTQVKMKLHRQCYVKSTDH